MPRINFQTAKPRQVEAYLREVVRKAFGDGVENEARVVSSHGRYTVEFDVGDTSTTHRRYSFHNFRRTESPRIAKAIRALAA